jgi:transposase
MQVVTVGLDIAKNVFQVHGIDRQGRAMLRRKVRRDQLLKLFGGLEPCLVGMEACATAHHWARELGALGHEVRLMPPAYVKAYVKRNKNDAADAERAHAPPGPPSSGAAAHGASECDAGASGRVRRRCRERHIAAARLAPGARRRRWHPARAGAPNPQLIEALTMQIRKIETELPAWHRSNPASQSQPATGDHSRRRGYHRHRVGRHRARCESVPIGPSVRRLARVGAAAELQRRQGAVGRHLQNGRPLSAPSARGRRYCRRSLHPAHCGDTAKVVAAQRTSLANSSRPYCQHESFSPAANPHIETWDAVVVVLGRRLCRGQNTNSRIGQLHGNPQLVAV